MIRNKFSKGISVESDILRSPLSNEQGGDDATNELWDTTHGMFLIKRSSKDSFVEVVKGTTKKKTHSIYGYASLSNAFF